MIHLSGNTEKEAIQRANEELDIYEEGGVDGAILENYCVEEGRLIRAIKPLKEKSRNLVLGVNVLPNEYVLAFELAKMYHLDFIQLDYVAGKYTSGSPINKEFYEKAIGTTNAILPIAVLGGVWPKYYNPVVGSSLEKDLKYGMKMADAIVVTGERTGEETPMEKILRFREIAGDFPLIIGAGLTVQNARQQLEVADGAIVGSYFKPEGDISKMVERHRVMALMDVVNAARLK